MKITVRELRALIKEAVTSVASTLYAPSTGPDPELLDAVASATRLVTHDDPNAVHRLYRIVWQARRDDPDLTPDTLEDVGSYFLDGVTNAEGVSDNDGATPRFTPDEFSRWPVVDVGRAVMQHFAR